MSISAVVLTKNEEKNIPVCLESLSWCDEVIVIDDNSTDATVEFAKKQKAVVYTHSLENDFSRQRNFGLVKAKNDWVLFVDADERVSKDLQKEIQQVLLNPRVAGFYLKREDYMWGKVLHHGEQGGRFLRLAKKESGTWVGKVHERWEIKGPTASLQVPVDHFPHPTVAEFLQDINYYSTLRAQELYNKGVRSHWFSILLHAKGKFAQDYLFKCGFLDGMSGFIVAMLMSFHAFLVRGKLWQLGKKS